MKSAWVLVKTTAHTLSSALKQAWADAKFALVPFAGIVVAEESQEVVFETGSKQSRPATYKQYEYLRKFDNVSIECNVSYFTSRLSVSDASDAIDEAKAGRKVVIR